MGYAPAGVGHDLEARSGLPTRGVAQLHKRRPRQRRTTAAAATTVSATGSCSRSATRAAQIIGFGGRVIDAGEPKYLNSPETPIFRKGQELYGLFEAKQEPGQAERDHRRRGLHRRREPRAVRHRERRRDARHRDDRTTTSSGSFASRIESCSASTAIARAARPRGARWRPRCPYGGGNVELKFLLLPEADDPDTFVRSRGADAFRGARRDALCRCPSSLVKELDARVDFGTAGRARTLRRGCEAAAAAIAGGQLPRDDARGCCAARCWPVAGASSSHAAGATPRRRVVAKPDAVRRREAQGPRCRKVINLALHYPQRRGPARARPSCSATPESTGQRRSAPRVRDGRGARRRERGPAYWKICVTTPTCSISSASAPSLRSASRTKARPFKELEESLQHLRRDAEKDDQRPADRSPPARRGTGVGRQALLKD